MKYALIVTLTLLTAGCSTAIIAPSTFATAQIALTPSATLGLVLMPSSVVTVVLPTTPSTPSPATILLPTPTVPPPPLLTLDQYRLWMEEARATYPYGEPIDAMWGVMMCESQGDASAIGGGTYHGLFQYSVQTWSGDWNPYRDGSIFDPKAQIFATAKAWQEGNQGWWACY